MSQVPAPVIIVDDFIGPAVAERLLQFAIAHEPGFRSSKVALGHASLVDESHRLSKVNSEVAPLMPLIEPAIREAVDEAIPKLGLVNVESYLLEPELTWCGNGSFFKRHTDTLRRDRPANQRVMTMVYYFHGTPKAFTGGELRLYGVGSHAIGCISEVEPRLDRAVFFPSWFPHEVLPVHCATGAFSDGRFAITCWVRRN